MRVTDRRLAPRNVAAIVKQGAARLGFDPSTFGGHSLRAGFVTSAVKRGANLIKITDVTGHKSLEMLKTYGRDAEAFVGHVETNTLAGKFHAFLIGNGGHSGHSGWLGR
jgi:site-specific recombinase XerD